MAKLFFTNGNAFKNIDFSDYPEAAWNSLVEIPETDQEILYSSVAAVYRAVNMSADAVANLPWAIVKNGQDFDTSDEYQNRLGWFHNPTELIRLWRLSLFMTNTAYGFFEGNALKKRLRYIAPTTITPIIDTKFPYELVGFRRSVGSATTEYKLDDGLIFHMWKLDHASELLPSKNTEFKALMTAAGVLFSADYFIQSFFRRGGIKPTMLMVKGVPTPDERERIERLWDKVIRGATKYLGKIFNAEAIQPLVIGDGVDNLKDQGIYQNKLSDIAMACGMPLSLLLANSANYATAKIEYRSWYETSVIPWANFIAENLNTKIFSQLGMRFEFRPETTELGTEEEVARASAYAQYVSAGMRPSVAAQVVGIQMPPGIEYADLDDVEVVDEHVSTAPASEPEIEQETKTAVEKGQKFIPTLEQYRELDLWQKLAFRKLKRGELSELSFEAKTIPENIALSITEKLKTAKTDDDIRRIFDIETMPSPETVDSVKLLAEAINRAVEKLEEENDDHQE